MSNTQDEGWIAVSDRLPSGEDAISCEAWCIADIEEAMADGPGANFPGPCIMMFDEDGRTWHSREDNGCWEPGEVTHWRPRPQGPAGGIAQAAIAKAAR